MAPPSPGPACPSVRSSGGPISQPAPDLVIRGGTVFTPLGPRPADVAVAAGTVVAIGAGLARGAEEVDGRGLWLLPGAVDGHVHSRDPGFPEKEDWTSLTEAAAAGGVTTVVDMPNTVPAVDSAAILKTKAGIAGARAVVDFALWAVVRHSSTPADVAGLLDAGAVGLKAYLGYSVRRSSGQVIYTTDRDDPDLEPPPDYGTVARLAPELARWGAPLAAHAEDPSVLREHDGAVTTYGDLLGTRPALAEALAVAALGEIALASGARVHVVHLSSAAGLAAARRARQAGAEIVLETCPQYLWLTEADAPRLGGLLKLFPLVRAAADRDALVEALRAGVIEVVGTDHAPHTDAEKLCGLAEAAPGSAGVQTLYLSCLELARRLGDPGLAVRWASEAPARALGLRRAKGAIEPGADADLVLVDPAGETIVDPEAMRSRQRHNALEGHRFGFEVRATWSRGRLVAKEGVPVGAPGHGRWVKPTS